MEMTGGGCEEKIFVSVRLRPLNEKEIARNDVCDCECINEDTNIFKHCNLPLPDRSMYSTAYTFDRVFRSGCSTKEVYEKEAKDVALSVVSDINSTVFAYGQTSSGKTFTMMGITEYAVADIYYYIEKHNEREFLLKFSAMEIYNESVRDLLSTDSTPLRLLDDPERGTVIKKLTEEPLRDWNHVMEILSICDDDRDCIFKCLGAFMKLKDKLRETALNETSSRSHQIIRLTIESSARQFLGKDNLSTLTAAVEWINFVDLGGSERTSQSLSAGTRLKAGCHINRSLLTLGTVIRKLSKRRNGHVPFRDSKLTRILQSSLGDNARTAIICTMGPREVMLSNQEIRYCLQRELARLESELRSQGPTFVASHYSALLREKGLQIEKLEKEMIDLTVQRDLAQSQVQDLLQLVGDEGHSMTRVGFNNYPHLQVRKSPECENPVPDTSPLASTHSLDIGVRSTDLFILMDIVGEALMITTYKFFLNLKRTLCQMILLHSCWPVLLCLSEAILDRVGDMIEEAEESKRSSSPEQNTEISESMVARNRDTTDQEFLSPPLKEDSMLSYIPHFVAHSHEKPSPWPLTEYMSGSQSLKLTKSRSEFSGRPEDIRRRLYELNYGANIERLSRKGSQSSIRSVAAIDLEAHRGRTSTDDNITSVNTCIVRMEEKAKLQQEKQVADNPSLSNWPSEFKRLRKEIIELWDVCNVSLVHKTYFFLLFKGDPTDSIYVEVELRRLSFLKDTYSRCSKRYCDVIFCKGQEHGGASGFVSGASKSCGMGYRSDLQSFTPPLLKCNYFEFVFTSLLFVFGTGLYCYVQLVNTRWRPPI
ncbi:hypothetical protein ACSBR1_025671 [Camellia fascicularis]